MLRSSTLQRATSVLDARPCRLSTGEEAVLACLGSSIEILVADEAGGGGAPAPPHPPSLRVAAAFLAPEACAAAVPLEWPRRRRQEEKERQQGGGGRDDDGDSDGGDDDDDDEHPGGGGGPLKPAAVLALLVFCSGRVAAFALPVDAAPPPPPPMPPPPPLSQVTGACRRAPPPRLLPGPLASLALPVPEPYLCVPLPQGPVVSDALAWPLLAAPPPESPPAREGGDGGASAMAAAAPAPPPPPPRAVLVAASFFYGSLHVFGVGFFPPLSRAARRAYREERRMGLGRPPLPRLQLFTHRRPWHLARELLSPPRAARRAEAARRVLDDFLQQQQQQQQQQQGGPLDAAAAERAAEDWLAEAGDLLPRGPPPADPGRSSPAPEEEDEGRPPEEWDAYSSEDPSAETETEEFAELDGRAPPARLWVSRAGRLCFGELDPSAALRWSSASVPGTPALLAAHPGAGVVAVVTEEEEEEQEEEGPKPQRRDDGDGDKNKTKARKKSVLRLLDCRSLAELSRAELGPGHRATALEVLWLPCSSAHRALPAAAREDAAAAADAYLASAAARRPGGGGGGEAPFPSSSAAAAAYGGAVEASAAAGAPPPGTRPFLVLASRVQGAWREDDDVSSSSSSSSEDGSSSSEGDGDDDVAAPPASPPLPPGVALLSVFDVRGKGRLVLVGTAQLQAAALSLCTSAAWADLPEPPSPSSPAAADAAPAAVAAAAEQAEDEEQEGGDKGQAATADAAAAADASQRPPHVAAPCLLVAAGAALPEVPRQMGDPPADEARLGAAPPPRFPPAPHRARAGGLCLYHAFVLDDEEEGEEQEQQREQQRDGAFSSSSSSPPAAAAAAPRLLLRLLSSCRSHAGAPFVSVCPADPPPAAAAAALAPEARRHSPSGALVALEQGASVLSARCVLSPSVGLALAPLSRSPHALGGTAVATLGGGALPLLAAADAAAAAAGDAGASASRERDLLLGGVPASLARRAAPLVLVGSDQPPASRDGLVALTREAALMKEALAREDHEHRWRRWVERREWRRRGRLQRRRERRRRRRQRTAGGGGGGNGGDEESKDEEADETVASWRRAAAAAVAGTPEAARASFFAAFGRPPSAAKSRKRARPPPAPPPPPRPPVGAAGAESPPSSPSPSSSSPPASSSSDGDDDVTESGSSSSYEEDMLGSDGDGGSGGLDSSSGSGEDGGGDGGDGSRRTGRRAGKQSAACRARARLPVAASRAGVGEGFFSAMVPCARLGLATLDCRGGNGGGAAGASRAPPTLAFTSGGAVVAVDTAPPYRAALRLATGASPDDVARAPAILALAAHGHTRAAAAVWRRAVAAPAEGSSGAAAALAGLPVENFLRRPPGFDTHGRTGAAHEGAAAEGGGDRRAGRADVLQRRLGLWHREYCRGQPEDRPPKDVVWYDYRLGGADEQNACLEGSRRLGVGGWAPHALCGPVSLGGWLRCAALSAAVRARLLCAEGEAPLPWGAALEGRFLGAGARPGEGLAPARAKFARDGEEEREEEAAGDRGRLGARPWRARFDEREADAHGERGEWWWQV